MESERSTATGETTAGRANSAPSADQLAAHLKAWRDAQPTGGCVDALRNRATIEHSSRWKVIADLELETVTPLYGGGTQAGVPDLLLPVRPRAVRSGIRNWWWWLNRFDEAGRLRSPPDLFKHIRSIWGHASDDAEGGDSRSKVRVGISTVFDASAIAQRSFTYLPYQQRNSQQGIPVVRQKAADQWLYALFPAKGELSSQNVPWSAFQNAIIPVTARGMPSLSRLNRSRAATIFEPDATPHDLLLPGLRFHLRVEVSEPQAFESVALAVAAWLHFGGIGARTSRGLGQLMRLDGFVGVGGNNAPNQSPSLVAQAEARLNLAARSWEGPPYTSAIEAWERGLKLYRDFRQVRDLPGADRRPGRSSWPKADVARAVSGRDMRGIHAIRNPAVPHFEGAAPDEDSYWPLPELFFGAPVIVKFLDQQVGDGEPYPLEMLLGRESAPYDRYASPVRILLRRKANAWHPHIVALPYRQDLAEVGAWVRNMTGTNRQPNNGLRLLPEQRPAASVFIEAGSWFPSRAENFDEAASSIWQSTPGNSDDADFLRSRGASDPIEVLFEYLRWRSGEP